MPFRTNMVSNAELLICRSICGSLDSSHMHAMVVLADSDSNVDLQYGFYSMDPTVWILHHRFNSVDSKV